jgi:large conductance mechanosensitive channel
MWKEFKTFIMRGNVLDLAIGIIIGGAFGKIISSFVNDIIMPPIGLLLGKVNFADKFVDLSGGGYATLAAAKDAGAATLNYGLFINNIIDFLIVALVIFLVVKQINKMQAMGKKAETPAAPTTKECPYCYSTIPVKATRCPNCTSELK